MTLTPLEEAPKWDAKELTPPSLQPSKELPKYSWVKIEEDRSEEDTESLKRFLALRSDFLKITRQITEICNHASDIYQGRPLPYQKICTKLVLLPPDYKLLEKINDYTLEKMKKDVGIDGINFFKAKSEVNKFNGLFRSDTDKTIEFMFEKDPSRRRTTGSPEEEMKHSPPPLNTESMPTVTDSDSKTSSGKNSQPSNLRSDLSQEHSSYIKSESIISSSTEEQKKFLSLFLPTSIDSKEQFTPLTEIVFLKKQEAGVCCFYYTATKTEAKDKASLQVQFYRRTKRFLNLEEYQSAVFPFPETSEETPVQLHRNSIEITRGVSRFLFNIVSSKLFDNDSWPYYEKLQNCFNELCSFNEALMAFKQDNDSKKVITQNTLLDFQSRIAAYHRILDFIFRHIDRPSPLFLKTQEKPLMPVADIPDNDAYLLLTATTPNAFKQLYTTYVQFADLTQQLDVLATYKIHFNQQYGKLKETYDPFLLLKEELKLRNENYQHLEKLINEKTTLLNVIKTHFPEIGIPCSFYTDLISTAGNKNLLEFSTAFDAALNQQESYAERDTSSTYPGTLAKKSLCLRDRRKIYSPQEHLLTLLKTMVSLNTKIEDPSFTVFFEDPKKIPNPKKTQQLKFFISIKIKELQALIDILHKLPLQFPDLVALSESRPLTSFDNENLTKITEKESNGRGRFDYIYYLHLFIPCLLRSLDDFRENYEDMTRSFSAKDSDLSYSTSNHRILFLCLELINKIQRFNVKLPHGQKLADEHKQLSQYLREQIPKRPPTFCEDAQETIKYYLERVRPTDEQPSDEKKLTKPSALSPIQRLGNYDFDIPTLKEIYSDLSPNHGLTPITKKGMFSFLWDWHESLSMAGNHSNSFGEIKKRQPALNIASAIHPFLAMIQQDVAGDPYFSLKSYITRLSQRLHAEEFKDILTPPDDPTPSYCSPESEPIKPTCFLPLSIPTEFSKAILFIELINFEVYFYAHFLKKDRLTPTQLSELEHIFAHLNERIQLLTLRFKVHEKEIGTPEKPGTCKEALAKARRMLNKELSINQETQEDMFTYLREVHEHIPEKSNSLVREFLIHREKYKIHVELFQHLRKMKDDLVKMQLLTALTLVKSLKRALGKTSHPSQESNHSKLFWARFTFSNSEENLSSTETSQSRSSYSESTITALDSKSLDSKLTSTKKSLDNFKKKCAALLKIETRQDIQLRVTSLEKILRNEVRNAERLTARLKEKEHTKKNELREYKYQKHLKPSSIDKLASEIREIEQNREELEKRIEATQLSIMQLKSILLVWNNLDLEINFSKAQKAHFMHKKNDLEKSNNFTDELNTQRELNKLFGL